MYAVIESKHAYGSYRPELFRGTLAQCQSAVRLLAEESPELVVEIVPL